MVALPANSVTGSIQLEHDVVIKRKAGRCWLMNTTVLDNSAFVDRIRGEIEALNAATVDGVVWQGFKNALEAQQLQLDNRRRETERQS